MMTTAEQVWLWILAGFLSGVFLVIVLGYALVLGWLRIIPPGAGDSEEE